MADVIQKIQFKRGTKENLELLLVGTNKPAKGEPIYEMDTGKIKIGDGQNNYAGLSYIGDGQATATKLVYEKLIDLPSVGNADQIYVIATGNTYRWSSFKTKYELLYVNNKQFYGLLYDSQGAVIGAERQIDGGGVDDTQYLISDFTH